MVGIWFQLIYRISPSEKFLFVRCINCKNLKLLSFEWWLRRWLSAVVICSLQDRICSCQVIPHWKPAQVDEYFSIQSYFWLRYVLMWIGQYKLINIEMDTVDDFPVLADMTLICPVCITLQNNSPSSWSWHSLLCGEHQWIFLMHFFNEILMKFFKISLFF